MPCDALVHGSANALLGMRIDQRHLQRFCLITEFFQICRLTIYIFLDNFLPPKKSLDLVIEVIFGGLPS